MRKRFVLFLILTSLLGLIILLPPQVVRAQGSSASEVIQAINQRRQQRGLPPLQTHPILMSIAQQHSNYQASLGHGTHVGPDGSSPKDRALAAGFGDGAAVFISENWASGLNLTITEAINNHWDDYWHRHTMYNENAKYIGVGIAYAGNTVYYTVDTGYWVGDAAPSSDEPQTEPNPTSPPQVAPVHTNTPNDDGSLTHTVQPGQTLWTISAVYDISLEELRELNDYSTSHVLQPGDQVLIHPAPTATPTSSTSTPSSPTPGSSDTPEPSTTPTHTNPQSLTIREKSSPSPTPSQTRRPQSGFAATSKSPLVMAFAVIVAAGSILLSLGKGILQHK